MKRIAFIFGVFALVTASAISCQKETPVEEAEKADKNKQEQPKPATPTLKTLTFKITDGEDTKMVLAGDSKKYGSWESGDNIGYITSTSKNGSATVALGTPPTFTIAPEGGLAAGKTIDVWYPYRADQADPSAVQLVIPAAQTQDASLGFDFDAMPMVAERITVTDAMLSESNFQGSIQFANLGSVICFKVFSSLDTYRSEKLVSVSFKADTPIAGEFTHDLTSVSFVSDASLSIHGFSEKTVTTTLSAAADLASATDKESAIDVFMVVAPGTYSGQIILDTDKAHYIYPIADKSFSRSGLRSFGLNLNSASATRYDSVLLPWYFAGGTREDLTSILGVSGNGLGSNYAESNAPYRVKFDTNGDYIQIKTDKQIKFVSLRYKKLGGETNSFITFKESSDGSTFTNVGDPIEVTGANASEGVVKSVGSFASTSRYIRIYYTKGDNLGVGPILVKPVNVYEKDYYSLVTSMSDLEFTEGQYVIGATRTSGHSDHFYFANGTIDNDCDVETTGLTIVESAEERKFIISELPLGAAIFTLEGDNTNGFTILTGSKYLYYKSDSNRTLGLDASASEYKWIIVPKSSTSHLEDGVLLYSVRDEAGEFIISDNATSASAIRGYFGNPTATKGRGLYLFKKIKE